MSSQGREDEILLALFKRIGTTNRVAVEFGAKDGCKCSNTYNLRKHHGWTALLMDCTPGSAGVVRAFVTAENVERLFAEHEVPHAFDLLSIDVDGNDFWIWKALRRWVPRVVVIEYNSRFGPSESVVMPYHDTHRWDKTDYYGASAAALVKLGREKGYTLVDYTPRMNLVFVVDAAWLPPADPVGYPSSTTRPWEVY